MYWVPSICVVTTFLLSFPDVDLGFILPAKDMWARERRPTCRSG